MVSLDCSSKLHWIPEVARSAGEEYIETYESQITEQIAMELWCDVLKVGRFAEPMRETREVGLFASGPLGLDLGGWVVRRKNSAGTCTLQACDPPIPRLAKL